MMDEIESARLAKLAGFGVMDTPMEREFDTLTSLASHLLNCPIAAVSLVDDRRQWFKSSVGLGEVSETPRDIAFCAHAIQYDEIMVVEDATADSRFSSNPLVTGDPNLRFYAGVPLRPAMPGQDDDLPGIGTLCIADTRPREFTAEQSQVLRDLAAMVSGLIQARASATAARSLAQMLETHAAEAARKNRQLKHAERIAGIGSWRLDLEQQSLEWSDNVFAIYGLPLGEAPNLEEALSYYVPEERDEIMQQLDEAIAAGKPFDFECNLVRGDGAIRRVRSAGEPEMVDGRAMALFGVFQDITDRHAQVETLRRSATTDSLTGLANRAAFEQRLEEAFRDTAAHQSPLALMLIDLDGFKGVNDSFGHDAGDEVLCAMSDRLRDLNMTQAFPARLGGDEFVLIVSRPRDCAELGKVVEQVVSSLKYTILRDGQERTVSATVGAAHWEDGYTPGDLIRNADLALYQAKRLRRGTGRVFGTEEMIGA